MTAFPMLRPPRQSPATAYLQHLQQKRIGRASSCRALPLNDDGDDDDHDADTSPQSVVLRKTSLLPTPSLAKPTALRSRSRSTGTFATCVSVCSDRSSEDNDASGNSANSNSSLGDGEQIDFPLSFPDDFVASTGASLTTETALVPRVEAKATKRDPPPPPPPVVTPPPGTHVLSTHHSNDPSLAMLQMLEGDDEDSVVALDRILSETSRRWSDATKKTHREFCRLSFCPCRQQEAIIAQQAAEIAQLREQLQQAEEEAFPLEQIEVYHDNEDHCSVTSGLTQHYDSASLATGQQPPQPLNHRPDADSVTGTQSLHQPAPSPPVSSRPPQAKPRKAPLLPPSIHDSKPPLRARNRFVSLTAADGTTRQAVYTGDVSSSGEPDGCGVLKFSTGDYYMGQLQRGQMHGQGTFVVNRKNQKKPEVLKGHFERNVYTG